MTRYHLTEYDDRLTDEMVLQSISEEIFARIRRDGVKFYVEEVDDELVAVATYEDASLPGVGLHQYIWVHPDRRGDTKGPSLLDEVASEEGYDPYLAHIEPDLQDYWTGHGWTQVTGNVFYL